MPRPVRLELGQAGIQGRENPTKNSKDEEYYYKESVHMNCRVWCRLHLLEYCQGRLVVGPQFQHMAQVKGSFLEMAIRF